MSTFDDELQSFQRVNLELQGIEQLCGEVEKIEKVPGGLKVYNKNGGTTEVDTVIMAVG